MWDLSLWEVMAIIALGFCLGSFCLAWVLLALTEVLSANWDSPTWSEPTQSDKPKGNASGPECGESDGLPFSQCVQHGSRCRGRRTPGP